MNDETIRFVDILTTASTVASYLGEPEITAKHLIEAVAIVRGAKTLDDLGRPVSPMLQRGLAASPAVDARLRMVVQRWFDVLGGEVEAELAADSVEQLLAELRTVD